MKALIAACVATANPVGDRVEFNGGRYSAVVKGAVKSALSR